MNCANHPEQAATAFCRICGKPLCGSCQRQAQGTILCEEDYAATAASSGSSTGTSTAAPPPPPFRTPPPRGPNPYQTSSVSPGLAFILGFIPGVGAVYNGQYAKGLIHAVTFGLLISIESSGAAPGIEPLIGILIGVWVFYMAFEAYHTASRRARGEYVDEFSSLLPLHQQRTTGSAARGFPVGPIVLIGLGVLFLMNTLELVRLRDILRFWPVFLIIFGVYLLWVRLTGREDEIPGAGVGNPQGVRND